MNIASRCSKLQMYACVDTYRYYNIYVACAYIESSHMECNATHNVVCVSSMRIEGKIMYTRIKVELTPKWESRNEWKCRLVSTEHAQEDICSEDIVRTIGGMNAWMEKWIYRGRSAHFPRFLTLTLKMRCMNNAQNTWLNSWYHTVQSDKHWPALSAMYSPLFCSWVSMNNK